MSRHERRILKIAGLKKALQESLYGLNWYSINVCIHIHIYTCFVMKEAQRAYDKDVFEQQLSSSITDPEVKKSLAKVQQKAFKNFSDSATVSSKAQVTTESGKQGKSGKRGTPVDLAAKAKAAFQESYNQRQMKPPAENKLLWWQLVTPEGHPYYYNTVTGGEYCNV